MVYSTVVEKNEEGLNQILIAAKNFEQDRVLYGLMIKRFDIQDVQDITNLVLEFRIKLRREITAVTKFAEVFNRLFATDNNKCFEVALKLFRKIRSSVSGSKRIYKKFCKTVRTRYHGYMSMQTPSVYRKSMLAGGGFCRDLFGVDSYPKQVKDLCDELEAFFTDLKQIIMVCEEVINEEKAILADPKRLKDIYDKDCILTRKQEQNAISLIRENKIDCNIDTITKTKSRKSLSEFLKEVFHRFSRKEFSDHIIYEAIATGLNNGMNGIEPILWKNNPKKARDVRMIIEHFDELEPAVRWNKKQNQYKIEGKEMLWLLKWAGLENGGHELNFVEDYFNKLYKGQYLTVKANAVNTAKKKFIKEKFIPEYAAFCKKVESLLDKYANGTCNNLPLAANS